ncbi:MAG: metallopeptidase family protein [Deltaproteobacteria bacterium]|nr:metallopeptidase family protein [Deltaproteobacteria bacterium]
MALPGTGEADRLLAEAALAFERGEPEEALRQAEAAARLAPRSVPALHYRAAALTDLGRLPEARSAYTAALAVGGDDPELLLGAADFLTARLAGEPEREDLEEGLTLAQRGERLARRRGAEGDDALRSELLLVQAAAHNQLGQSSEALAAADAVLAVEPEAVDAMLERGFALWELLRLDEARDQLLSLLERAPDEAWAHHTLGLVAERRGDAREAERRFARARRLAPDDFPEPVRLAEAAFDRAVEDALRELPEQVRHYLANVAIAVEPIPADDDLRGSEPPLSPGILGIFRGSPLGQKGSDPWSHFPSSIVLYQRNLERFAHDRDDLLEQIGITLLHEVGHFLGLDEEELYERGLE